jgi:pSer/pThr/pTyr-binding forkhead associated (FHA) protein
VDVQIYEGSRLKPGRFVVDAEVVEGAEEALYAELVLPDGSRVQVSEAPVVIGRLPECDVVIADSNVSRRHAEVRQVGENVVVTDLGSTNGTRVNGQLVREQVLASGDEITVGSTTLVFELS